MRFAFLTIICLTTLVCQEPAVPNLKTEGFYPTQLNNQWIYELDSVTFDVGPTGIFQRKSSSYLREIVQDTFTDGTGALAYLITSEVSGHQDGPWQYSGLAIVQPKFNGIEKVEDNLRFLKIKHPVKAGVKWDGTSYFDPRLRVMVEGEPIEIYKNWSSTYAQVDYLANHGGIDYPQAIKITLAESESKIELRKGFEVYAYGVGLVYKELQIMETQNISNLPWEQKAEKGFILKQTLLTFK